MTVAAGESADVLGAMRSDIARLTEMVDEARAKLRRVAKPTAPSMPIEEEVEHLRYLVTEMTGTDRDVDALRTEFSLTVTEGRILAFLLARPGVVHSDNSLLAAAYYDRVDTWPEPRIAKVFVCKIRQKIDHTIHIQTVWGRGYWAKRRTA